MQTSRFIVASVLTLCASTSTADVNITLDPTEIPVHEATDVAIFLTSNPGLYLQVCCLAFEFDNNSDAWQALNPIDFSWTPEVMHDPGLFLINEELPNPAAIAMIGPSVAIEVPDGVAVQFATLTLSPSDAIGTWSLPANVIIFDMDSSPLTIKSGDPFVIAVMPEPAAAMLLALGTFMICRRRHAGGGETPQMRPDRRPGCRHVSPRRRGV